VPAVDPREDWSDVEKINGQQYPVWSSTGEDSDEDWGHGAERVKVRVTDVLLLHVCFLCPVRLPALCWMMALA
jgi:hypothetical protein